MQIIVKQFHELSLEELYNILKVRAAIFVVEQDCPYLDLDDKDQQAIHVWLEDEQGIQAYCRVLDRGVNFPEVSIGRVVTATRGKGLGKQVMQTAIAAAKDHFAAEAIRVSAQVYAKGFYETSGFRKASAEYLEDNIPHIEMLLEIS